jgi:hypothetical protein
VRGREGGMLELQRFLIKERVAFLRSALLYDLYDADDNEQVGIAREVVPRWVRLLRWLISRHRLPTRLEVFEGEDESLVFILRVRVGPWRRRVEVRDADEHLVGYLATRVFTWGRQTTVYNKQHEEFARLEGDWSAGNFSFVTPDGRELGAITRKSGGLGRKLFSRADSYLVTLGDELLDQPIAKMLLLATALAIDLIFQQEST